MKTISVEEAGRLYLGLQGEHQANSIAFDVTSWCNLYGPGQVQLLVQRCGDADPYPVAIQQNGNLAVWQVEKADTLYAGVGKAQLLYFVNDTIVKSCCFETQVCKSLGGTDSTVSPAQEGWVQQVLAVGSKAQSEAEKSELDAIRAQAAANEAEQEASHAETAAQKAQQLADGMWAQTVQRLCSLFDTRGPVVSCHPVKAYPLTMVSHLNPVQEGAGDPSPTNVRPITGWEGIRLTHCGKNLLKLDGREVVTSDALGPNVKRKLNGNMLYVGIAGSNYFYHENVKEYSVMGDSVAVTCNAAYYGVGFDVPVKPNTKYTVSGELSETGIVYVGEFAADGSFIQNWGDAKTITTTENTAYVMIVLTSTVAGRSVTATNPVLNLGATAQSYERYWGSEISKSFDQPVYGGEYDWETGKLAIRKVEKVIDGSYNWTVNQGMAYAYESEFGAVPGDIALCDSGVFMNNYPANDGFSLFFEMPNVLYISRGFVSAAGGTAEGLKKYFVAHPMKIVYRLSNPMKTQFTPQPILALDGTNTLYSDAGDTTVQGYTDPVWERQQLRDAIAALGQLPTV